MSSIGYYLKNCHQLTYFCSRNGWIDNTSLRYTTIVESIEELLVDVDELLLESCGYEGICLPCSGQIHLFPDRPGRVVRAEAL